MLHNWLRNADGRLMRGVVTSRKRKLNTVIVRWEDGRSMRHSFAEVNLLALWNGALGGEIGEKLPRLAS